MYHLAKELGEWVKASPHFKLLAEVRFNVTCFTLSGIPEEKLSEKISSFLKSLTNDGRVFMTASVYQGQACIRAAFSNWQTTSEDLAIVKTALDQVVMKN